MVGVVVSVGWRSVSTTVLESALGSTRGAGGNSFGVSMMTSATRTSASIVRRSMRSEWLRNGIISADMERMTPSNAANSQHQPSPCSVF